VSTIKLNEAINSKQNGRVREASLARRMRDVAIHMLEPNWARAVEVATLFAIGIRLNV